MTIGLVTGLISLLGLLLKYLNYKAGSAAGVAKAEALGAVHAADQKLAKGGLSPQEMRDNETVAVIAHHTLLQ